MRPFAPVRIRIEKDAIVRMHRSLKGKGRIFVAKGQEVTPSDIIGSAHISSGFRSVNLADLLQVSPTDVQKYLTRPLGQRIYKDELLAQRKNFFGGKKVVISPTDGVLDFLNQKTGELRMSFLPKKADLLSGLYGIVENIDKEKGQVIVRTQVNIVYGMFGSGKMRDGVLHLISRRDGLLGKTFISPKYDGHILVGGSLVFKDAISSAISASVAGIISGGINAKDYKGMAGGRLIFPKKLDNDIGVSIVVCEGFGSVPIGDDIYEILARFNGKYVSLDGNRALIYLPSYSSSSLTAIRKTVLPPQSEMAYYNTSEPQLLDIATGLKVRVIGNSYSGYQGKIVAVDRTETVLPSGVKSILVVVETKRSKVKVPVANLEIIL